MKPEQAEFEQIMRWRDQAVAGVRRRRSEPLGRLVAHRLEATFFGPRGGFQQDPDEVWRTYEQDAAAFSPGGESRFEIIDMAVGDQVAYWTGLQRAKVKLDGSPEATPMDLRVTEVFRREDGDGGWSTATPTRWRPHPGRSSTIRSRSPGSGRGRLPRRRWRLVGRG